MALGSISDRDGRFSLLTDSTEPDSLTARYVGYEDVRSWVIPRMLPGELVVISMRSLPIEMVGIVISATREGQSSGDVAALDRPDRRGCNLRSNPGSPG